MLLFHALHALFCLATLTSHVQAAAFSPPQQPRATSTITVDATQQQSRSPAITAAPDMEKRLISICLFGIAIIGQCSTTSSSQTKSTTSIKSSSTKSSSSKASSTSSAKSSAISSSKASSSSAKPSSLSSSSVGPKSTSSSASASASNSVPTSAVSSSAPSSSAAVFSYPQPVIPSNTASSPAAVFTLSPLFVITSIPQTRRYTFNIQKSAGSPSGFLREIFTINNQYPGPVIEANSGDTIIITVNNQLDAGQAIHWHGLHQNGTAYNDGVPGISQCPIPSGGSYTYQFTIDSQYGSYWYHSHYANTLADGIIGAFVIHSPEDPYKLIQHYDDQRLLYLSDWMNDQSTVIVDNLLTGAYKGDPFPPQPDAVLINGIGQTNCTQAQAGTTCNSNVKPAEVHVVPGERVRFRVMNTGSHALLRLSIDQHTLSVIEVDDTPITPVSVHELPINPGQRYSVIVTMNQGAIGSAFWIRASVGANCIFNGVPQIGTAILRYTDVLNLVVSSNKPTTSPWSDLADPLTSLCTDLDQAYTLSPLVAESVSTTTYQTAVMNSSAGNFVNATGFAFAGFGINGVSYQNQINDPLLVQIENGLTLDPSLVASATFNNLGTVDIIINQLDPFVAHPFHLHGRSFYIVARGSGTITADELYSIAVSTTNPLRRDTIQIPNSSYAVLRLITDTPGVWPLHCHIGWHLSEGKLAAMIVRPDSIAKFSKPSAWSNLCSGTDPNAWGPGRRSIPPQARHLALSES